MVALQLSARQPLMVIQDREHIIALGRTLAAELAAGCEDRSSAQSITQFLDDWRLGSDGALAVPAVAQALDLLTDYDLQPVNVRRERVQRAVSLLRDIFRKSEGHVVPAVVPEEPATLSKPRIPAK
ncbi:hypothetical protein HC891_28235, partial [Candidatus Gracilibacteria bacterium]|nr:hypothetical protein [Candidatus Gracilibacteria bacterium]